MAGGGVMGNIQSYAGVEASGTPIAFGGYGDKLKRDYRRVYGSTVGFAGRGEMVPNKDTSLELDPRVVDKYGIPVLRFHFQWSDYERKQSKHMQETFRAIIQQMGGTPLSAMPTEANDYGLAAGGRIIHELGLTRLRNDPNTTAPTKNCQAHDARNVFVTDGGPFVSQADKKCTGTILPAAMRTSHYIPDGRRKGQI